ncbi:MAG: glycosyl hydrolase [Candidatus Saccharicenans sp.]
MPSARIKFNHKGLRNLTILLLVFSLAAVFYACHQEKITEDTLRATYLQFQDPPAEYRPMPLWVWNEDMTADKVRRQLEYLKDKGFGGGFVHPRPGLITPYLTDEWLSLFKEAVQRGKELGLKVWVYDENSYPSGFAGGLVPAALPEAARSGLKATKLKKPDLKSAAGLVCVLKEDNGQFIDITERIRSGETGWPEGEYWTFEVVKQEPSPWYGGFTYVDLMRPGVTQAFLHLTHDAYKGVVGEEFGKTIPGSFQDEAEIAPAGGAWAVNYTPALFEEFSKRRGYDLKSDLPSLFEEKGDFLHVRHDFYLTCLELFIENWARPYYEYCSGNNLQLTGHYWEHEWPIPRVVPDSLAMSAYAHVPGIDILMNQWSTSPHAQFGNARAVKEVRSVANQLGRKRVLSETYGASGWDLTFFDQKRIGDWEYALGVNLLNQHLVYSTIIGARKRDHPLSFSYHEPWWDDYRLMNDYFARLSVALSSGEQVNPILVIEPTTSAWMYYSPVVRNEKFEKIGTDFQNFVHQLEKFQVEYDLVSEMLIKDWAKVENKSLVVGRRKYSLIVLPPGTENLEPWTAELLKNYLKSGGKILSWAEAQLFCGGQASNLAEEFKKYGNFIASSSQEIKPELFARYVKPRVEFLNLSGADLLFHHCRQLSDGQLVFLANISPEKEAHGTLLLKGRTAEKWDAFTGVAEAYPVSSKKGRLRLEFSLKPGESLLLAVYSKNNRRPAVLEKSEPPAEAETLPLKIETVKRLDDNVLTIDYCDLFLKNRVEKNLYFYRAQQKVYEAHGWQRNPWDSGVQYLDSVISKNKFAPGTGFRADFRFVVKPGTDLKSMKLAVERPWLFRVKVNGQKAEPQPGGWWLDRNFGLYVIGDKVKTGENVVSLEVSPFDLLAELEPVYVLGNFSVEVAARGFTVGPAVKLSPGSWKQQGLPFYAQRVAYEARVEISPEELTAYDFRVKTGSWSGSVAQLWVNGRLAGRLLSPSDSLKINELMAPGSNVLSLVVIGSLKNTLGPHHNNPPAGAAWPGNFKSAPEGGQPSGAEYNFQDYGLHGPLFLLKLKKV